MSTVPQLSLGQLFLKYSQRELLLVKGQVGQFLQGFLFFFMMVVFFPLALPPENHVLRMIAPAVIGFAFLFSFLLISFSLFQADYEEGVIEQWLLSGYPLSLLVATKLFLPCLLQWVVFVIFCPILALLFQLNAYEAWLLAASLSLQIPVLWCFCALAAALTTSLKQKGLLMPLIVLPLTLPLMILGGKVLDAAMHAEPLGAYFALLLAILLLSVGLLPMLIAALIRVSLAD